MGTKVMLKTLFAFHVMLAALKRQIFLHQVNYIAKVSVKYTLTELFIKKLFERAICKGRYVDVNNTAKLTF